MTTIIIHKTQEISLKSRVNCKCWSAHEPCDITRPEWKASDDPQMTEATISFVHNIQCPGSFGEDMSSCEYSKWDREREREREKEKERERERCDLTGQRVVTLRQSLCRHSCGH